MPIVQLLEIDIRPYAGHVTLDGARRLPVMYNGYGGCDRILSRADYVQKYRQLREGRRFRRSNGRFPHDPKHLLSRVRAMREAGRMTDRVAARCFAIDDARANDFCNIDPTFREE